MEAPLCIVLPLFMLLLVSTAHGELSATFYVRSCPKLEPIVRNSMREIVRNEPRKAASILPLFFHDCFVNGCDAWVLLADTPTFTGEQNAKRNRNSIRGMDKIEDVKANVEAACSGTVSCAATDHLGSLLHDCAKSMADCVDVLTMALEELDHLGQGQLTRSYDVSIVKVVTFATEAVADANAFLQLASEVQSGVVVMDAAVETVRHTMQLASVGVAFAKCLNDAPKQHAQRYRIHLAPSGGSI